jgi:hypothetical protein
VIGDWRSEAPPSTRSRRANRSRGGGSGGVGIPSRWHAQLCLVINTFISSPPLLKGDLVDNGLTEGDNSNHTAVYGLTGTDGLLFLFTKAAGITMAVRHVRWSARCVITDY